MLLPFNVVCSLLGDGISVAELGERDALSESGIEVEVESGEEAEGVAIGRESPFFKRALRKQEKVEWPANVLILQ